MLVEILVFGGEEGVDDELRHRLDRQIEPALARIFGEQRAVRGVHARHHRRLVVLQRRVVGKVLRVMEIQADREAGCEHENDGPQGEQEPEEAKDQPHPRVFRLPQNTGEKPPLPAHRSPESHVIAEACPAHAPGPAPGRTKTIPRQALGRRVSWPN
jgi:hypothetical protein